MLASARVPLRLRYEGQRSQGSSGEVSTWKLSSEDLTQARGRYEVSQFGYHCARFLSATGRVVSAVRLRSDCGGQRRV